MRRESLDAPDDLSEEDTRQVTFGGLEDVVTGTAGSGASRLEQPLLQRIDSHLNRHGVAMSWWIGDDFAVSPAGEIIG